MLRGRIPLVLWLSELVVLRGSVAAWVKECVPSVGRLVVNSVGRCCGCRSWYCCVAAVAAWVGGIHSVGKLVSNSVVVGSQQRCDSNDCCVVWKATAYSIGFRICCYTENSVVCYPFSPSPSRCGLDDDSKPHNNQTNLSRTCATQCVVSWPRGIHGSGGCVEVGAYEHGCALELTQDRPAQPSLLTLLLSSPGLLVQLLWL